MWVAIISAIIIFWSIRRVSQVRAKAKSAKAAKAAEEAYLQKQRLAAEERQRRENELEKLRKESEERAARIAAEREAAQKAEAELIASIPVAEISIADSLAEKQSVRILDEISTSNITVRTDREKLGNFIALDVETTGLSIQQAEIIDVAAVRFENFQPVEAFSTLCFPRKGINPDAAKVNGIHEEDVDGKPTFQQIAASLQDFIGSSNLVGHNLFFDLKFITKYGVNVTAQKRKYYDTLEISQRTVQKFKYKRNYDREFDLYDSEWVGGDVENYKLGTLCEFYKIPTPSIHRALGDAVAAGRLFQKLSDARKQVKNG